MSRVLNLKAENILRLSAIDITPGDGPTVFIAGRNAQGKSSVLDVIAMALGGSALIPKHPIKNGETRGEVTLDLGDYIVTRQFAREVITDDAEPSLLGTPVRTGPPRYTETSSQLTVRGKDGARIKSPQALLDRMVGDLSFDPLEFMDLKPELQAATLRRIAGIDTAALDGRRLDAFEERTAANRNVKSLEARVSSAVQHPDAPAEEVSIDALAAELEVAQKKQRTADEARRTLYDATTANNRARETILQMEGIVARLEKELAEARSALEFASLKRTDSTATLDQAEKNHADAVAAVPDVSAIHARMKEADAINRKVRENAVRAGLAAELEAERKKVAELAARIAAIDVEKEALLTGAAFPVAGLGLSDEGPTFGGELLAQASTAEKMRVSVAMGLALNPDLKVLLVRQGNDLDDDAVKLLSELAAGAGAQVWLERIAGNPDGVSFVIEDGAVRQ